MSDIILSKSNYEEVNIKRYDGKILAKFYFNPSDAGIVERYGEFVDNLANLSEKIKSYEFKKEKKPDFEETEVALKEVGEEIYAKVDKLLNEDASKDIFSVMHPLSLMDDGNYYFIFIVDQIGIKIKNATGQRMKKLEMKIKKHTSKYHG